MQYEYNVWKPGNNLDPWELEDELNKRGKQRWRLVSDRDGVYVFEREKQPRERARLGTV